ncbi:MAG: tyrosine-type recombinase/integrase [Bacteroidetes bacterium]|nr:tyrosine-type recombinase/integrase [Bacteroidota bacterium]
MEIATLANQFYEYSIYFKGYSKATIRRYRHAIRYYYTFAKITHIEQVSLQSIQALFVHGRSQRKWQANTFLSYHKSLSVFFSWCKDKGYIPVNPTDDIEVPKIEYRIPVKLSKQDAFKLLELVYNFPWQNKFIQTRNYAIFSTFLFAGIRKTELLNLKYSDIDIENATLFVKQGKGNKDRIIPICPALCKVLKQYLEERKKKMKTCPEFFTSSIHNSGFNETSLKRLVEKIRGTACMNFSIHKLRHTFATLMLEGGCDIYSLSKMMGHNNIKTTTIYLAASVEHLRNQILKHPLDIQVY